MVWAIWGITVLSFLVWLHHFFTMGAGADVNAFFGIMTMIIAIPTGVKVFNWLFTMYRGRIRLTAPMLWFLGFVTTFAIGGATGVMMAVPAIDFQLHNSLFLVAHFHNMIIGGVLFGYFAGLGYWFPKVFGFRLNEPIGKLAFYAWLVGFILAFGPLYILGMMGATRRLDHYDASLGWQWLFIIAGVGVLFIFLGVALQVLQLVVSIFMRRTSRTVRDLAGDPWDGRTLEWSVSSPAPIYNFAIIPTVRDRDAWWDMKYGADGKKAKNKLPKSSDYRDISLPKNSGAGIVIAAFACVFGFGVIWHIWWLVFVAFIGILMSIITRTLSDDTEYIIPAAEVARLEKAQAKRVQDAQGKAAIA